MQQVPSGRTSGRSANRLERRARHRWKYASWSWGHSSESGLTSVPRRETLSRSVGPGDGHVHRRRPDTAIVGAFVERGDLSSVVAEAPRAADIGPTPMPGPVLEAQLLGDHVPLAVEEVCSVDSLLALVANDLDPADRDVTDPPVRRVENEASPGGPFVHIARGDLHRWSPVARHRMALGDPLSDEDIETIVFRPACRFHDPTRCNSGNRLLRLAGAHDGRSFLSRALS